MKHLKTYEKLKDEEKLKSQIKTAVDEVTDSDNMFNDDVDFLDDCPFLTEINILHQRDYIDEMYCDVTSWSEKISLVEFREVYNKLIIEAEETILNKIIEDPFLYEPYIDNYINVPKWIVDQSKYNL